MRSKATVILAGVGAFLFVTALLLRFYAYPALAVAPQNQDSTTVLVGPGATILDRSIGETKQVDLETTIVTVGDVDASEAASEAEGREIVVWNSASSTLPVSETDPEPISRSKDRIAFDSFTGEAVNCCDTYLETTAGEQVELERSGLLVKFPFNTQKETYDWFDSDLKRSVPIDYEGTEDVEGVSTYKFSQVIDKEKYADAEVPASYLGLDQEGNVDAEAVYSNTRTLWVEPNTGVILKRTESQLKTLNYEGEARTITTQVDTGYDDATIKASADEFGSKGSQLNLVRNTLPLLLGILGLLLLAAGIFGASRQRSEDHADEREKDRVAAG